MSRTRISTTVDADLLLACRAATGTTDAVMMDRALHALLASHRAVEIDAAYAVAYRAAPLDTPDVWGDLASFGVGLARARGRQDRER